MVEIIIRSLQGTATEAEEAALLRWRQADPAHEQQYVESAQLWALTASAAMPVTRRPAPTVAELLAVERPRRSAARRDVHARWRRWIAPVAAAAAVILLLLGVARHWGTGGGHARFAAMEFTTGTNEMVTATLGDGSVVRLAPNSRLRVLPTSATREVWLDGKAYFAVAKQPGRPFIVRTSAGDAQVLGTRFEVRVDEEDLRVVVVEGKVALSAAEETVQVRAGEVSRVAGGGAPTLERIEEVKPELGWLSGFLVFQNTPLAEVAREIEQQYGLRVLLADRALAERTVTASFTNRSAEEVLTVVCRVVDARCSLRDSIASIEP